MLHSVSPAARSFTSVSAEVAGAALTSVNTSPSLDCTSLASPDCPPPPHLTALLLTTWLHSSPALDCTPPHHLTALRPPHLTALPAAEASHEILATFYPTLSAIMLDALLRQAKAAEAGPGAPQPEPGARLLACQGPLGRRCRTLHDCGSLEGLCPFPDGCTCSRCTLLDQSGWAASPV